MNRKNTVLLVDDEPNVLEGFQRGLRKEPYTVLTATSAEEGLRILAHTPVDVVISDEQMPKIKGSEFLAKVHREYPKTIRIILTGQASLESAIRAINDGEIYRFLTKPCSVVELAKIIRKALLIKKLTNKETTRSLAFYDEVTGLPNRNYFLDHLRQTLKRCAKEKQPVSLLTIDIDNFKEINATFSRQLGDILLKNVGRRLKLLLRPTEMIACLGGDEFALLLPLMNSEAAEIVAEKTIKIFNKPFKLKGLPISVEVSIGIAISPTHGSDPELLVQRAERAMYKAKDRGVGFLTYDLDTDQHSPRQLSLMGALRHAIENNQLRLHYQPKVDLNSGVIFGVEALVRWAHPEEGMIPPDQFIPQAEQTGLIRPLTEWVLMEAKHQCQAWNKDGIALDIAINLSARNLNDQALPKLISRMIEDCKGSLTHFGFEVTESAVMADESCSERVIKELHDIGVRFSIDDFGTGYSSLVYLKKFAVNEIKIDRSFISHLISNEKDLSIVRSTIDLGHDLSLKVVAEGVEDQESLDKLIALGCDAAQGYYICYPLPAAELERWLHDEAPRRNWRIREQVKN